MKKYLYIMSTLCSMVSMVASSGPAFATELDPEKIPITPIGRDGSPGETLTYSRLAIPFGQSYNITCPREYDPPLGPDDVKDHKKYVIVFVRVLYTNPPGATNCEQGNPLLDIQAECPADTSRSCLVKSQDDAEEVECKERPLSVAWRCEKASCPSGKCRRIMVMEILP